MDITEVFANKNDDKIFGKFRAVVKNLEDPEKLGRIKVECFEIYGEDLSPWAWPCLPYGGSNNNGIFFLPEIGSGVWIEFEQGHASNPIWVGTWWTKPDGVNEVPKESQDNYSTNDDNKRKVIKTSCGHIIEFSDQKGKRFLNIVDANGNSVKIDTEANNIVVKANNNITLDAGNDIFIKAGNNITETAGNTHRSNAAFVHHN